MQQFNRVLGVLAVGLAVSVAPVIADDDDDHGRGRGRGNQSALAQNNDNANCRDLPTAAQIKTFLQAAPNTGGNAGGLFAGRRMWGAIVNRDGELCAYAASMDDETQVWPGSQAIAKAKAYTANAFSLDSLALSTARLYTFVQPGHSLASLGNSNLFDPNFLAPPSGQGGGINHITGGLIFFGGGVPLYKNGKVIGGLGVSGDTACTDHEIAKRVRVAAGLTPPPAIGSDDITYSSTDGPSVFTHPLCVNTFRNGAFIGNEPAAAGY
jgi:uncharacterized protein GlcG (DUF336 family)